MYLHFQEIRKKIDDYFNIKQPNLKRPSARTIQNWLNKEKIDYKGLKPRRYNEKAVKDMLKEKHNIDIDVMEMLQKENKKNEERYIKDSEELENLQKDPKEYDEYIDSQVKSDGDKQIIIESTKEVEKNVLIKLLLYQFGYSGFNEKNIQDDVIIKNDVKNDIDRGRLDLEQFIALKNLENLPLERYLKPINSKNSNKK